MSYLTKISPRCLEFQQVQLCQGSPVPVPACVNAGGPDELGDKDASTQSNLHEESVTHTVNREKVSGGSWIWFEFAAQLTDVLVQGARIRVFGVSPHSGE
jgi:Zn ribbon nucleic-acid-binding protein